MIPHLSHLNRKTVRNVAIVAMALLVAAIGTAILPGAVHAGRQALDSRLNPPPQARRIVANGTLLYTVSSDEHAAIYGVGGAGAGVRQLIDAGGQSAGAVVSPDGSAVVYLHAACPRCLASYEVRTIASGETRIVGSAPAQTSPDRRRADVAWSSDGTRLAFTEVGLDSTQPRIFMSSGTTGERRPLASSDTTRQSSPVWSPDGHTVAYLAGGEQTMISAVDVETGEFRRLNDQLDHAVDLAWSPDGRFLSVRQNGLLWLIDAGDGHGYPVATPGPVVAIGGWAPGSRSLVVTTTDKAIQDSDSPTSVFVVQINGGAPTRLSSAARIGGLSWASDGRQIAWTTIDNNRWTIWRAPSNGGAPHQVSTGTGTVSLDAWQ